MRQFVCLGHDAPTTPDFSLDDLAGGAGRLDVLCRCVSAAFFLSHAIREDVRTFLVLRDAVTIRLEGRELRRLNPDERSTAALLRRALERRGDAVGHADVESSPGISVSNRGLDAVLGGLDPGTPLIQLHGDGSPIVEVEPPDEPAFVLSDHRGFTDDEVARLADAGADRVSLGPRALHANHAIAVAHNYLDTAGYTTYR